MSDEESDSDAEDDYVDDIGHGKPANANLAGTLGGARRVSVCAELVDPNAVSVSKYTSNNAVRHACIVDCSVGPCFMYRLVPNSPPPLLIRGA
jgi:hypothetical protein